ncbi:endo-1,4-D-glucanase [Pseudomonas chlororaphis]|jgi:endo-1,4-beta-D-glucanase Y|uniref:cellulase n=1 Tax=Pseudomonas morbosilactucae TaxID=2938197 RepID=A0A9X2C5F1_9PSED|nr:cellulose synthase complex periplasmic endoglucanase BcsZ [Pseudomonas morbosilactucae]MCK9797976.1 cellulose synthase complex periplasmic endoglucanase BcsZ [Pseudomonas morbosilactucae]MCK9812791.1 cellulose synthase complex periplasmic endoglucanase BcsZ [Pseudomonas morbosilactucae]ROL69405.1 endo-1,4-D-glucanase [Pseudomonas chlororaphis]WEK06998.1 MAG: cellulose synthase complex periplasmic endoglucanase BcsZ [Pseudomonas sp.]
MTPRLSRFRQLPWRKAAPVLTALALLLPGAAQAASCSAQTWPLWQDYVQRFVQDDGRMLGSSMNPDQSSSEGQSYGMFFALVANDPQTFERLWRWTKSNMAGANIAQNLPGWLWGANAEGAWGILDKNSASDADLWFAYALLEADRLWKKPEYRADAHLILSNVEKTLVKNIPGLGKMLLPGPVGYEHPDQLWRFNASYMPIPLMRRFTRESPDSPWKEVANSTAKMIADKGMNPYGFVPDWIGYRGTGANKGRFGADPFTSDLGSYDAIRTYLWAGMTPAADPLTKGLLEGLDGMAKATVAAGVPPEKVHVLTRAIDGNGFYGFSAAVVPLLRAKGLTQAADQQQAIVNQSIANYLDKSNPAYSLHQYYHVMLSLFSLGWSENRYQFNTDGTVKLSWEATCASKP